MTTTDQNNRAIERPEWLPETSWPFDIRTIQIDDDPVAYTDEGKGPTILLVSDGLWSFVWGQLITRLKDDFRVVTLDFPGAGLTPEHGVPPSLSQDSRLLEGFVEALGLEHFTIAAHDLGGPVGLGLATRRPELVSQLVLINTFGWPPTGTGLKTMFRVMSSKTLAALNAQTNLLYRLTSGSMGIGRHLDDIDRGVFRGPYREKANRYRFHELMRSVSAEGDYLDSLNTALPSLAEKQVLTIYGERNDPFGFQARFQEIFPHADEMVIPKGNHFPMCDDPDGVSDRIRSLSMG